MKHMGRLAIIGVVLVAVGGGVAAYSTTPTIAATQTASDAGTSMGVGGSGRMSRTGMPAVSGRPAGHAVGGMMQMMDHMSGHMMGGAMRGPRGGAASTSMM